MKNYKNIKNKLSLLWLSILLIFSFSVISITLIFTNAYYNVFVVFILLVSWCVFIYLLNNTVNADKFLKQISFISLAMFIISMLVMLYSIVVPDLSFGIANYEKEVCAKYINQISFNNFFCVFGFILFGLTTKYVFFAYLTISLCSLLLFKLKTKKRFNFDNHYMKFLLLMYLIFLICIPTIIKTYGIRI